MSDSQPNPRRGAHRSTATGAGTRRTSRTWAVVGVLLTVGIVVPLLVPVYDQVDPTLWGFPFYYWFQFAMIPVVSLLTFAAFRLSEAATRKDREDRGVRR